MKSPIFHMCQRGVIIMRRAASVPVSIAVDILELLFRLID